MATTAQGARHDGDVNPGRGATRYQLYVLRKLHQEEETVRVESIAHTVGDRRNLVVKILRRRCRRQGDRLSLRPQPGGLLLQPVKQLLLLLRKGDIQKTTYQRQLCFLFEQPSGRPRVTRRRRAIR
jgi:hypothetical protein